MKFMTLLQNNFKNTKNTKQIIYNILKLYVYVLVISIILTLILFYSNVIYLDSQIAMLLLKWNLRVLPIM